MSEPKISVLSDAGLPTTPEVAPPDAAPPEQPSQIGRYRVEKILGEGGFGVVYLAHDDQLQRLVAIKVPHARLVSGPEDAEAYLVEARTVANLDHTHIVPVYDVGGTEQFPCFVVSKYIDGTDLKTRINVSRPALEECAELVATVAEALQYAHKRGIVHRDIKPGNILLDTNGKPYVADFGLALKEENVGQGPRYAGTPAYMSPEQANGESHRLDGRSDIFSLGILIYELITGRRPFHAETREQLLEQIASREVRPPRQWDDTIPKEVERICLKALSKRASERYTTAKDLADDLRQFLAEASANEKSTVTGPEKSVGDAVTAMPSPVPTPSDQQPMKIVPKGLRSFDAHDADFFLELLPGPRDRNGLPDSIRFWKSKIETTEADNTFAVGLIYGPSGCGKSSLVKAGLFPRLSDNVLTVYVEATAEETEIRLLNGLRKSCPALPATLGLKQTVAALRRGEGLPVGKKVLIVLDQFEQWLHAKKDEEHTELVQALRQCDGGRVQCVVMVRDDFWMAATRFMRELEIRLLEGQNSAATDLFDIDHARKVLAAFGRAFGKLPENPSDTSKEQKEFLRQAVLGLAQEGKVVCVRLALFAQMVKGKAWTPATLKEIGGTEGVGVTFLEDTFSAATAPPVHRYHQKAARAVLKALLPESGTDIKGSMRPYAELREASGYANRPQDFADLLRILDSEIRLITPTDPEGKDDADPSTLQAGAKYYQLTHDYLVPSLRDWLTRKQKETRRGRAELLLADRAAVWNARPENRQLPSLLQWLQICWHTRKKSWTPPQRRMMGKAGKYHAMRAFAVGLILALLGLGSWEGFGRLKSHTLRDRMLEATTTDVPGIVKEMQPYRRWLDRLLHEAYTQAENEGDVRKQLHASLALETVDPGQREYLYGRLLQAEPLEVIVIREALSGHQQDLTERLWTLLENPQNDHDQRLRAACALADFAPDDPRWAKLGRDMAATLVAQKPFVIAQWTDALKGAGKWLIPTLAEFLVDEQRSMAERGLIATVYGTYAAELPDATTRLEAQLDLKNEPNASVEAKIALARKQSSIGVALLVMGRAEKVRPLFEHRLDPTLRSYLIDRAAAGGVDAKVLIARLDQEKDVSVRRAILLSLGEYGPDRLLPVQRQNLTPRLLQLYRDDADPGIHGASEWLLRQWHMDEELKKIDQELATGQVEGQRQWYISKQGQTMIVLANPGEFWMGEGPERHRRRIGRSFALASKEVTVEQFLRFRKEHQYEKQWSPTADCPMIEVTWYGAGQYCNWLSAQEGIPKEQWCYLIDQAAEPVLATTTAGLLASPLGPGPLLAVAALVPGRTDEAMTYGNRLSMAPNYLQRTGYRLPTEAEWEYACRAGAETAFSFGEAADLLNKHAWNVGNALSTSHPVGLLRPNDWGLCDMHGNAWEWCQEAYKEYPTSQRGEVMEDKEDILTINPESSRVLRGGAFNLAAVYARSACRIRNVPTYRYVLIGFRPARTLTP